jgi:hypothetical protein
MRAGFLVVEEPGKSIETLPFLFDQHARLLFFSRNRANHELHHAGVHIHCVTPPNLKTCKITEFDKNQLHRLNSHV